MCIAPMRIRPLYQSLQLNKRPTTSMLTYHTFVTSKVSPSHTPMPEEDQHPNFNPKKYYPAHIGATISGRYRIISKLGWGVNSTVWLAKDIKRWSWQADRYITLKITNTGDGEQKSAREEVEISQHISRLRSSHEGQRYIRLAIESFEIQSRYGNHLCLVFEPLREPLWMLGRHLGSIDVPSAVLKPFLKLLLQGLDFLHSECGIIHTDLKADNFLLGFEDPSVIDNYILQQETHSAPLRLADGYPVYQSRPDFGPLKKGVGLLKISDFGTAVFGNFSRPHNYDIQPQPFCAPEVLLKATWTYSADIWNLGNVLWELLADTTLFNGIDPSNNEYSREAHLAQMIRLLGPPPSSLLEKAEKTTRSQFFTDQGEFKFPHLLPWEDFNISNRTPFLEGEDKRLFLEFAKRMLQWEPEKRAIAKELYNDPWLSFKP